MKSKSEFCWCNHFFCLQGDFGQSHKYCPSDDHPLDFYSYGRTVLVNFKSDAFMTGNGLNVDFKIASKCFFLIQLCPVMSLCAGKTDAMMFSFSWNQSVQKLIMTTDDFYFYIFLSQVVTEHMNRSLVTSRVQAGLTSTPIASTALPSWRHRRITPSLCSLMPLTWRPTPAVSLTTWR